MPIEYRIDHERRLVLAKGRGALADADVFEYQREVWSRPDVAGYNELIDMTEVVHIAVPSQTRVRELARLSAGMDDRSTGSRFAIFALVAREIVLETGLSHGLLYRPLREWVGPVLEWANGE